MILDVSPESPALVRGAATFILVLHIGGGAVGLLSGAVSLALRKGSRGHRLAGHAFFVSMSIMSAIGAAVSPFLPRPQWSNVIAGAFTFYLVATAWATVRRTQVGAVERVAFVGASLIALGGLALGLLAIQHPGLARGAPPGVVFVIAGLGALAAAGDLRWLRRGGQGGRKRLARHLWRMCLALFIAAGSLFLGQPQVFPPSLRGTPVLFLPEVAVLAALVFWLIRVRGKKGLPAI